MTFDSFARIGRGNFVATAALILFCLCTIVSTSTAFSFLGQSRTKTSPRSPISVVDDVSIQPHDEDPACTRRSMLGSSLGVAATLLLTSSTPPAQALDMDSFMSQELSTPKTAPSTQKFSDDEALCKFGQPSKERGDACVRAGLPTTLKKGGVDAYGNVDRGSFVRCRIVYVEDPDSPNKGFLMKKTVCE